MDKERCEKVLNGAIDDVKVLVGALDSEIESLLEERDKLKAKIESLLEEREELKAKNEEMRLVVEKLERLNENRESERRWEAAVKTSGMWQEAQKRGMERAWELARKIVHLDWDGAVCGPSTVDEWFDSMTAEDALDAMGRYEKRTNLRPHWMVDMKNMRHYCSECGAPTNRTTRFCTQCGSKMLKNITFAKGE